MSDHNVTASFHPLATLFPEMDADDFDAFAADVAANGLQEPIALHRGQILDGRARYKACLAAGIEPEYRDVDDQDALGFLLSANLQRRHLTASQRAMIAARLPKLGPGRVDAQRQDARSNERPPLSREERARLSGVGVETVKRADSVIKEGIEELVSAVEAGFVPVDIAAKAAKLPPEKQRAVLQAGPDRIPTVIKQLARDERERELSDRTEAEAARLEAESRRYAVILADPPWRFEPWSPDGMDRAADNHYPTMTIARLNSLVVPAAPDCALFLWATVPMMPEALEVMASWGFRYRSHVVWAKDRQGTGYWFRNEHELLLLGTLGSPPAPAPGKQFGSVIAAPVGRHSEKPAAFYDLIEDMFPSCRRLEMFARAPVEGSAHLREGWDYWGNMAPDSSGRTP